MGCRGNSCPKRSCVAPKLIGNVCCTRYRAMRGSRTRTGKQRRFADAEIPGVGSAERQSQLFQPHLGEEPWLPIRGFSPCIRCPLSGMCCYTCSHGRLLSVEDCSGNSCKRIFREFLAPPGSLGACAHGLFTAFGSSAPS